MPGQPSRAPRRAERRPLTSPRLLRALLDIALDDERFAGLAARIRAGEAVDLRASGSIRPYLLAALLDADEALAGRAGAGGRRRRRRRPRPRPRARRLPGARAASATTRRAAPATSRTWRRRRTSSACGSGPSTRSAAEPSAGDERRRSSSPAPSRSPRRSPTPRCARPASPSTRARRSTSATSPSSSSRPATSASTRSRSAASSRSAAASSTSSGATEERAARLELFGDEIESIRWFSTFTQRSLGEAERIELDPAAELALEHRELAELAATEDEEERPDVAELLPVDSFRAPLDLIGERHRDRDRRRRGDPGGARGPLGGRDHGDARRRRPPPLRRRRRAARRSGRS